MNTVLQPARAALHETVGDDILALTRELCEFKSGVVAAANEGLFARIGRELPIRLHRFASGSTYNGWVVPDLWQVKRATISRNGKQLFDGTVHPLGVAAYSKSFRGVIDFDELSRHVVTNAALPDAYIYHCMWQYRPWSADWAVSIPYNAFRHFGPGSYEVVLETVYESGEMLVADYELPGRSTDTIVLNCHTCHPGMANDAFCGVATLIRLVQWLQSEPRHYTYRLVLGPEHLGTVFYLRDKSKAELERFVSGIFPEMLGTPGPIRVTSTFLGGQRIDLAMANAVRSHSAAHVLSPWRRGAGNDETVWEAPGYEVPFVEFTRCIDSDYPYPEYHTSLDTPELLDPQLLSEAFDVLRKAIESLEQDARLYRRFNGLTCLSNPEYNLYFERFDPAVEKDLDVDADKWGHLLDSLFRYFDGSMTILEIAEKHQLPFDRLLRYLRRFEEKDLVEFEHAALSRPPISDPRSRRPK